MWRLRSVEGPLGNWPRQSAASRVGEIPPEAQDSPSGMRPLAWSALRPDITTYRYGDLSLRCRHPPSSRRQPLPRFAQNNRPKSWMRRPPRASESNISFSFEIVLLRQVSLAWSNRGGVRSGPCIQVFGVRQGSRRRGAEGHFHLSRRVGRDWPVMPSSA